MTALLGELIGTAILMILGNGVNANVSLNKAYGKDSGWIVITFGWAMAVFIAVFITAAASGAHLNPAVTIGLAVTGDFSWAQVPGYLGMQVLGAMIGAFLIYLTYYDHYDDTSATDPDTVRGTFCTGPAIPHTFRNVLSEVVGTFVLVYAVLHIAGATVGSQSASLGALDALPVAFVVLGIGMSLGGTTGYAINPARDFGPRLVHSLVPLKNKKTDWGYAWIPIVGPVIGAVIAAGAKLLLG